MFDPKTLYALIEAHKTEARSKEPRRSIWRASYATKLVEQASQGAATRPDYTLVGNQHIPVPGLQPGLEDLRSAVEANFGFPFIDSMVANICPSTPPQVTVNARRKQLRDAARYREALCNEVFRRVDLRADLWRAASLAGVVGEAFIKTVWDMGRQTVDYVVRDPLFVYYDPAAPSWDKVRYVIEAIVLNKEEFDERVAAGLYTAEAAAQVQPSGYPSWLQTDLQKALASNDKAARQALQWVVIFEVYDLTGDGRFFHYAEGHSVPLLEDELPYKYIRNPYHRVCFNDALIDMTPISDIELIYPYIRQLNDLQTIENRHALATVPIDMVDENAVDNLDEFIDSRRTAVNPGDMIRVATKDGKPLDAVIRSTPQPTLQVDFLRAMNKREEMIQYVLGQPAYQRGQSTGQDMATEVVLMDSALRTRNGRRQQVVNLAIMWAAEACVAIFQEFLPDNALLYAKFGLNVPAEITRKSLGFDEAPQGSQPEPQFLYDFSVVPGASVENSRLVRIKNIRENWPIIQLGIQQGIVDGGMAMRDLIEALDLANILKDPQEAGTIPAVQPPGGAALPPAAPPEPQLGEPGSPGGPPANPEDMIAEAAQSPAEMTGKAVSMAKALDGVQPK